MYKYRDGIEIQSHKHFYSKCVMDWDRIFRDSNCCRSIDSES